MGGPSHKRGFGRGENVGHRGLYHEAEGESYGVCANAGNLREILGVNTLDLYIDPYIDPCMYYSIHVFINVRPSIHLSRHSIYQSTNSSTKDNPPRNDVLIDVYIHMNNIIVVA